MLSGGSRLIFFGGAVPMIDVFYDRLDYNHPIEYRDRLEIHPYCVSLTDLLLQKLQIVQINDKDLKDAMLLLLAAQIGDVEEGKINAKYVAKLMAEDWGFYHTCITNLGKLKDEVEKVGTLSESQREIICAQVDTLVHSIENAPKSWGWKMRAKTGTKKIWYKEVSDWA